MESSDKSCIKYQSDCKENGIRRKNEREIFKNQLKKCVGDPIREIILTRDCKSEEKIDGLASRIETLLSNEKYPQRRCSSQLLNNMSLTRKIEVFEENFSNLLKIRNDLETQIQQGELKQLLILLEVQILKEKGKDVERLNELCLERDNLEKENSNVSASKN